MSRSRFLRWLYLGLAGITLIAACGGTAPKGNNGAPRKGGVVTDAIVSDPPTLDWSYGTSTITFSIGWHIFEQLFALDKDYSVRPMLASGYTTGSDGLSYKITLRHDVHFHDGSTLGPADVVASLERWGKVSSIGKQAFAHVASVRAAGADAVEIQMKSVFSPLISDLAAFTQACIIVPARVAEAAGTKPLQNDQLIGTGPYKFSSWTHGQAIKLVRFDGYSARSEDWGGMAGKKTAFIDEINFKVVPSAEQRLNGLMTGEFDFATDLSPDSYNQLKSASGAKAIVTPPINTLYFEFNKARPPFNDPRMREAVNLLMDKKQVAAAAFGPAEFWSLDDGMFMPDQKLLYTNAGDNVYKDHDTAKAKQLLQEAGYSPDRPIRILTTKTYMYMYDAAVTLAQELNQIGMKTSIEVYDWPTDLARRMDKEAWDIFDTGFSQKFDPTQDFWITATYNGWYDSAAMSKLLNQWDAATSDAQRKDLIRQIQQVEWQELPAVKVANQKALYGEGNRLHGYLNYEQPYFFNDWVSS